MTGYIFLEVVKDIFRFLGPAETRDAFEKHFNEELATYGHICIINLVEQTGREKIIADTYTENVCDFSCPDLTYCLFDFHEYWSV
jgi:phosphatidylinositol 4-phosphatase